MSRNSEKSFHSCHFVTSVFNTTKLPYPEYPEIAFVGRSNCGKSSLLNALVDQKSLAIVSNRPGRTASLNFYNIDETIHFVDMPGYGFAKISKKLQNQWSKLIFSYLSGRTNLRILLLLIDARRGIIKTDMAMLDYIQRAAVMTRLIYTKSDLVKDSHRENVIANTEKILHKNVAIHPEKLWVSAKTGEGIKPLRRIIKGNF